MVIGRQSLIIRVGANIRGYKSAMGEVGRIADRTARRLEIAFLAAAAATTFVGSRFEQALIDTATIADAFGKDLIMLEERARQLGRTTAFTATKTVEGMKFLAQAGLETVEIVGAIDDALKLAGATGASMSMTTTLLAATMRQFSLDSSQATRIVDSFSAALDMSLLTMDKIKEAMKFAGTVGSALGMTIEQVTAAIAAFADLGLEGSMVGTNFRMALIQLGKQTVKAADALEFLNVKFEEVNPEVVAFSDIIRRLSETEIGLIDAVQLFGARAGLNVLKLIRLTKTGIINLEDFERRIIEQQAGIGRTAEKYNRMMTTFKNKWVIVWSALQDVGIELFDMYKEEGKVVFEFLTRELNNFSKTLEENQVKIREGFKTTAIFAIDTFKIIVKGTKFLLKGIKVVQASFAGLKVLGARKEISDLKFAIQERKTNLVLVNEEIQRRLELDRVKIKGVKDFQQARAIELRFTKALAEEESKSVETIERLGELIRTGRTFGTLFEGTEISSRSLAREIKSLKSDLEFAKSASQELIRFDKSAHQSLRQIGIDTVENFKRWKDSYADLIEEQVLLTKEIGDAENILKRLEPRQDDLNAQFATAVVKIHEAGTGLDSLITKLDTLKTKVKDVVVAAQPKKKDEGIFGAAFPFGGTIPGIDDAFTPAEVRRRIEQQIEAEENARKELISFRKRLGEVADQGVFESDATFRIRELKEEKTEIDELMVKYGELVDKITGAGSKKAKEAFEAAAKARVDQIGDEITKIGIDRKDAFQDELLALKDTRMQQFEIEKEMTERTLRMWKEADFTREEIAKLTAERLKNIDEQRWAFAAQQASDFVGNLHQFSSTLQQLHETNTRNELDASKQKFDRLKSNAQGDSDALRRISQRQFKEEEAIREKGKQARIKAFRVTKALAIVETTIATAVSAVEAYKSLVGIPIIGPALAPAAAAAAIAAGMAQVALIASQQPPSFDEGGINTKPGLFRSNVPEAHIPLKGGKVPVRLEDSSKQAQDLRPIFVMNNPVFQDLKTQQETMAMIAATVSEQILPGAFERNYNSDGITRQLTKGGI